MRTTDPTRAAPPVPHSRTPGIVFPALPDPQAAQRLAFQFQLEQSQWWGQSDLEARQFEQLAVLLEHARRTVPYYRDLFAARGINLPTTITREFLTRLPVSRRRDLQQAGQRFFSTQPPREHGEVKLKTTSGSTGQPLRFAATGLVGFFWQAIALRDHLWHGRDFSAKQCAIRFGKPGVAEDEHGVHQADWGPSVAPLYASGPSALLNVTCKLPHQLAWLHREKPEYLISFPSNYLALIGESRHSGVPLPQVREIRTVGETLTPEHRRRISEAWGAKVTDLYSCEEAGFLALQCPEHPHYHVQSESVILEILDERDQPCPPGQPGRVVITSLTNFATPMIRMDLGDIAEFGEPCPCGRGLPVLRAIHGRVRNRVRLPDGSTLYPRVGEEVLTDIAPDFILRQFKGIQHSYTDFEMLIAANRMLTPQEQAELTGKLRTYLGHPFDIRFTYVDEIPFGPTGKRENFECRMPTPDDPAKPSA